MALGPKPNGSCDWWVFGGQTSDTKCRVEDTEDWDIFGNSWEAICENPKHYSRGKDSKPHYRCRFCHTRTDNDIIYTKGCPNGGHLLEGLLIMVQEGRNV